MTINGEHNKFLRVTLGNVISVLTMITCVMAIYFKLDARETATEVIASDNVKRLDALERQNNVMMPRVEHIDTNVSWLMDNAKAARK